MADRKEENAGQAAAAAGGDGSGAAGGAPMADAAGAAGDKGAKGAKGGKDGRPPAVPKPKLTKAERRAKQEAQRAAKGQDVSGGKASKGKGKEGKDGKGKSKGKGKDGKPLAASAPRGGADPNRVDLFSHLPQPFDHERRVLEQDGIFHRKGGQRGGKVAIGDPAAAAEIPFPGLLARVGVRMSVRNLDGTSARAVALLLAFRQYVQEYEMPVDVEMAHDLLAHFNRDRLIDYIVESRPLCVGMGQAITAFKSRVAHIPNDQEPGAAKEDLCEFIDQFIEERIKMPIKAMAVLGAAKISDGDVIMTFGNDPAVEAILYEAATDAASPKRFSVVVVDTGPDFYGRTLVKHLDAVPGISCTYCLLNGMSYAIRDVDMVFLGCSSLLSNGSAKAPAGTAMVATLAASKTLPVIFCCESYKFSEHVQIDSITSNEIGDPDALWRTHGPSSPLSDWRTQPNIKLLNLVDDLTPSECISVVITELGLIPPTSVPVVIREFERANKANK